MSKKKKKVAKSAISQSLALSLSLTTLTPSAGVSQTATAARASSESAAEHLAKTQAKNQPLLNWLQQKKGGLSNWMLTRGNEGGIPTFVDFYIWNQIPALRPLSAEQAKIAEATKELYDSYLPGTDGILGTFFESGHPWVQTGDGKQHQWDSLRLSGMSNPKLFEEAIQKLSALGVKNFRIGPNLHELDPANPSYLENYEKFVDKLEVIWKYGGTPTVSVAFFPSLVRWRTMQGNQVDYEKSYLLNPNWPKDMGDIAANLMKRIQKRAKKFEAANNKKARIIINPINEPETLAGFNRHFWHGAHANWGSPELMRFYIPSIIQIAKANVLIRQGIEREAQGERILFMHNEAMTPDYYPSHNPGAKVGVRSSLRFAVDKFMLGDEVLMKSNFESRASMPLDQLKKALEERDRQGKLNEVDACFKYFVFGSWNKTPEQQENARKQLVAMLTDLKNTHVELGKPMRADNMLNLDYYYQTEFLLPKPVSDVAKELTANQGAKLKQVLGVKSDEALLPMLKEFAKDAKRELPQAGPVIDHINTVEDLRKADLLELMSKEDYALLSWTIGLRGNFEMNGASPYKERQTIAGLRKEGPPMPFERTDGLLNRLVENEGALLKQVLGVSDDKQLRSALEAAARDTSDKQPAVEIKAKDSLRDILDRNGRTVLNRILGLKKNDMLHFVPNQYGRQIRAGIRDGFLKLFMTYINELKIHTVGVGESGTPFYVFSPMLHDQVMMEYVEALKLGVYGTQYAFGPAVDTKGWAKGPLSLTEKDDFDTNPSGALMLEKIPGVGMTLKFRAYQQNPPWAHEFINGFFRDLRNANQGQNQQ